MKTIERTPIHTATRLIGLMLLVSLLGCAVQGRPARPADFPFHASERQLFDLHWRLERTDGAVMAVGVVGVAVPNRIAEVTLELQGLDKDGRIVSRGFDYARPMSFSGEDPWPFTIRLRPKGQEERFVPRVSDVTWRVMRGG